MEIHVTCNSVSNGFIIYIYEIMPYCFTLPIMIFYDQYLFYYLKTVTFACKCQYLNKIVINNKAVSWEWTGWYRDIYVVSIDYWKVRIDKGVVLLPGGGW